MKNNLSKVENCLRSIARRNKYIKYSLGLAILFLMMGISAFSEEVVAQETVVQQEVMTTEQIATSKENLRNSVGSLQAKIESARAENEKGLAGLKLELIQLMEQGDQVVKSLWSSWQFGANYMYSKWNGTYKGRGDKAEKYPYDGVFTRSTDLFERVVSPLSDKYKELATSTNPYAASSNARNGLGSGYGLGSTEQKQEPLVTIEINAAIKPKSIQKNPISLDFTPPNAPTVDEPDISQAPAPSLSLPEPQAPNKEINIVKPNADPFTGFFFNSNNSAIGVGDNNMVLYSGVNPDDIKAGKQADQIRPALKTGALDKNNNLAELTSNNQRPTNILYRNNTDLSNLTFHIRGYFGDGSDGYTDAGSGHNGGSDTDGGPTLGTIGVHTLRNSTVSNIDVNLYGRAGFLTSETWRHGKVTMVNTNVNVYGKDNAVYYIMPAAFQSITKYIDTTYHVGALQGTTNVKMYGSGNTVYLSSGISGARLIKNDGKIELEGASNIV